MTDFIGVCNYRLTAVALRTPAGSGEDGPKQRKDEEEEGEEEEEEEERKQHKDEKEKREEEEEGRGKLSNHPLVLNVCSFLSFDSCVCRSWGAQA